MKEMPTLGKAITEKKAKEGSKPKKKKKEVDKDTLKSAMNIKNIGDGIQHAATIYANSKKKK